MRDTQFWNHLTELVRSHRIVIDRPKGTTHPRYPSFYYPLDYGYLDGTSGGDGQAIDVWVGSGSRSRLTSVICTVDLVKRDAELKLLLGCSRRETELVLRVHNQGPQSAVLIPNPRYRLPHAHGQDC